MKVLLFLGAGASVELGIPAMRAMAQELHSHLASQRLSQTVLARFEALLSDADYDIEHLIETIDGIVDGATQRTKLGLCVADDLDAVAPIMSREAEWYIQHVCEQLREGDARVLWSAALRKTAGHELCLATTNYDRSIEIGCRFNDVVIDDGFELFGDGREFARCIPTYFVTGYRKVLILVAPCNSSKCTAPPTGIEATTDTFTS